MWYQLYRRLVWISGTLSKGMVKENLPSPQFDPWSAQTVASSYTVYATPYSCNIYFYTKLHFVEVIEANDAPGSQTCTGLFS